MGNNIADIKYILRRKQNDSIRQQAKIHCDALTTRKIANLAKCQVTYATHKQRWGRIVFHNGSNLMQNFRSENPHPCF